MSSLRFVATESQNSWIGRLPSAWRIPGLGVQYRPLPFTSTTDSQEGPKTHDTLREMRSAAEPVRWPPARRRDGPPRTRDANRCVDASFSQEIPAYMPDLQRQVGRRSHLVVGFEVGQARSRAVIDRHARRPSRHRKAREWSCCTGFSVGKDKAGFHVPGVSCRSWGLQLFC